MPSDTATHEPLVVLTDVNKHFGQLHVLEVINLTIGMITPPVGALLFVTSVVTGVPMDKMNRDLMPMLGVLVAVLLLLVLFPPLTTWLPGVFG